MLSFLNVLFFAIHLLVIFFNLFGWIWKRTRRMHLWVAGITWVSWILLGLRYGLGYCFLTDWHWDIKRKLGEQDLPNSFVQYLIEQIGVFIKPETTDYIAIISFVCACGLSIYFNFFKRT